MTLVIATKKKRDFDPKTFLSTIGEGRRIVPVPKKQTIYAQGAACDAVFYIQTGKVRLTVFAKKGKEATIGILNPGDFFGEGGLAGQPLRMGSATAMTDCELMRIDKKEMMLALHRERTLSDMFTAYLLGRNIRYEEDLVDQLFNSSEKRLARILLLLAHFGKEGAPETVVPKISQETLAEMVGTTRSRVSFFMNRFRKLGFIQYNGKLEVHTSLLNIVAPRLACRRRVISSGKTWLYSRADLATLGFAISLVTSASVALFHCFLLFFLPIVPVMSRMRTDNRSIWITVLASRSSS
jgi:CRP/FNR family cyclic AMP-dependent transcriptional regulator